MNERKIILVILSVIVYCMYSVQMWLTNQDVEEKRINNIEQTRDVVPELDEKNYTQVKAKVKIIPLFLKDACSILQIFTEKPEVKWKKNKKEFNTDNNTITVIGITVFLTVLIIIAILDVLQVKEEERAKRKLNPSGERRQSLAEFANKKSLSRESSKFGFQLFQIAESFVTKEDDKKISRPNRPYVRGESMNSYLGEGKGQMGGSSPTSTDTPTVESRLVKRQSVAKIFGARPVPMIRRSSFPAIPLNPEVQALMLGHRQTSFDSDDESDGKGRRVRIIRRY